METKKMKIAVNRSTSELVGYWTPKGKEVGIVVIAYAVDDLQIKFEKAVALYEKLKKMGTIKTKRKLKITAS